MLCNLGIPLLMFAVMIEWCCGQCSKEEYKRCVTLADPLLKDSQLIYPDNLKDIDRVCRSWSQFVDCVKKYTDLCFTENKRREFNKAVESSVDLVHQMCTSQDYQTEYLKHAPCMRATLTYDSHCGRYYKHLVSQVSGEPATPALCCSHFRFRECLLDQTQRFCDTDAYPFAKQILNKAMGFFQDQCSSYKLENGECPGSEFYTASSTKMTPTWIDLNTAQLNTERIDVKLEERIGEVPSTTVHKYDWTTHTWTTSSPYIQPLPSEKAVDNTRTAHSRGMNLDSFTDPSTWKASGGLQTASTWEQNVKVTTMSNLLIDEPNQQGLSNENSASSFVHSINDHVLISMLIFVTIYFCY